MWDLWWTKWHWDRFFPRVLRFFPCQFHSTGAPLLGGKKKDHVSLHLHHKGCTISLKAAVPPQHLLRGPSQKKILPRRMFLHNAVKMLSYQRAMRIRTERGFGVQDEFVLKQIMKFCETRCRGFTVEVPVNCRAAYIFRNRRVAQYL
jgi:hypothetical protein